MLMITFGNSTISQVKSIHLYLYIALFTIQKAASTVWWSMHRQLFFGDIPG